MAFLVEDFLRIGAEETRKHTGDVCSHVCRATLPVFPHTTQTFFSLFHACADYKLVSYVNFPVHSTPPSVSSSRLYWHHLLSSPSCIFPLPRVSGCMSVCAGKRNLFGKTTALNIHLHTYNALRGQSYSSWFAYNKAFTGCMLTCSRSHVNSNGGWVEPKLVPLFHE